MLNDSKWRESLFHLKPNTIQNTQNSKFIQEIATKYSKSPSTQEIIEQIPHMTN